ncbi:hypothetical protein CBR_g31546 [Chara braunii]|uniref:Reverse transcriptase domain-containing protein n=1 Tax=Chara braunii TaxID=69332 RepID=A0A388LF92_CHABU|nr:hypothetical protein CBR_g31546 [Chara braunii]|eukprot:GBG80990.1 hypothetical protein CBR_g31546 [Chara braunii]
MEGPYFRRYDDRRVPYYDVNLALEALFFDGRDVTGFVEKWESYAYRKRFSEREWIDYLIQHSDPELDTAIRAIYPSDGRWRTFRASLLQTFACDDLIPTVEGLRRITRGERESLVAFTRRFKRLSQALVDRGMLSEVDRCVMFMLHLPEEKRKEVLEKAPRDSANFEKVAEVVFIGGGVNVREYMKETLDMALRHMRGMRSDGPRGSDRPPPALPGPRWGDRATGWRNESIGQGGWRNDKEIGGDRGSDWGNSHWKDARDGRWGEAPQARAQGPRPEVRAPPPPTPPPPVPPAPIAAPAQGGPRPNNPQAQARCVYCNEEKHIKRDCPYLTEALRLGVVKLNENKWVVWGDSREAVSFYPSMKVNVDKRVALQEARLGKKPEVGGSSSVAHIQMVESPEGLSIRESQVSSIKFIDTRVEEERPCLRVRMQVGTETSENQASVTESTEVKSGDNDQPMTDAKAVEEKTEEPTSPKSPKKRGPKKFEMKCTLDEIDTVAPLRRTLMQPMQCTLLEYLAASKSAREELLSITRKVRVPLAVVPTVPVEGPAKEEVQATCITMEELPANFFSGEEAKKFYVLESGQLQAVVSGKKMRALVDNGSESTVCRDSIARELGLEIDRGVSMSMVVEDNKLQPAEGVCHSPVIEVAGVEATLPIFSVKESGGVKKHKTVAEKVKPATVGRDRTGEATISEEKITDIIRKRKETEGQRITADRLAKMDIGDGNLTEKEKEFIAMTLRGCDKAIVFDDSEKGRIDPRYAEPARIHTVPHVPWKDRPQWKYAQKEKEEIVTFIKEKIRTFVAEPCESAYSNKWIFLRKGGSNKLRWIHNLQKTNSVTIRDVGSIPEADLLAEGSAGRSIYSICDLFSGYDEIPLDYRDRHMTAMHTPLGLVQMMVVPMGWKNGVAVFQRAMIAVLKEFIPEKVEVFLDDFPIKGAVKQDETEVFPGVRKFVADHMKDVRDVLEKLDDANLTVRGTKSR